VLITPESNASRDKCQCWPVRITRASAADAPTNCARSALSKTPDCSKHRWASIRTLTGERELTVGIVACLQTHGSRANWHPHLHLLVTDGGFRPDGTFVSWPVRETARLAEAFRRAVLRLFVRLELFDEDQAAGMLTWKHYGFHVHTGVWVPEDDRAFAFRLARYCARNPVELERLTYDRTAKAVTYPSDKSEGPTAGTETANPLKFLARVLVHIPDKGHVTTRVYGVTLPIGPRRYRPPTVTAARTARTAPEREGGHGAPLCGTGESGDRARGSTDCRLTPIGIPIPSGGRRARVVGVLHAFDALRPRCA
ncbi:transposase, partial [Gemmatimonas sp.]|uniref:transposase n=1 Tax=Gemmatimonas sp. TaxID=1962908 RepID=UPI00391F883E